MKATAAFALLAVATLGTAQKTYTFERKYAVGDSDVYALTTKLDGSMSMQTTLTTTQTVTKVYDNGDADIEAKLTDGRVKVGGFTQKLKGSTTTMRMSKYGAVVSSEALKKGAPMDFSKFARTLPKGGIKVGQSLPIDETDSNGNHVVGTIRLKSVENGMATLVAAIDMTIPKVDKPMHLDFTTVVDAATGKADHLDGTASSLPGMPGAMGGSTMTVHMERKPA